jgi:hypothetical protein
MLGKNPRAALAAAAAVSIVGVAVAGTVSRDVGGLILLAGWVALVAAIHVYGRAEE